MHSGSSLPLSGAGGRDAFLAKYGTDGSLQWCVSAGGKLDDVALGVAVRGDGHVAITGYYQQLAYFGEESAVVENSQPRDTKGVSCFTLASDSIKATDKDLFLALYSPHGDVTHTESAKVYFGSAAGYSIAALEAVMVSVILSHLKLCACLNLNLCMDTAIPFS